MAAIGQALLWVAEALAEVAGPGQPTATLAGQPIRAALAETGAQLQ